MAKILSHDRYQLWFTPDELHTQVKERGRCEDINDDFVMFVVEEVAVHGSPNDDKVRFCFETLREDFIISDSECVWKEEQKGSPTR